MMLPDRLQKIKAWIAANAGDLFLAAVVFLVGVGGFGLGRLSILWQPREPIRIERASEVSESSVLSQPDRPKLNSLNQLNSLDQQRGNFVASKNGSSYHLPNCPGAKQIKPENLIQFASEDEAKRLGYKPAGNCPGLK